MKNHILIVEDESLLLEALKYRFESEGFLVETASDGKAAHQKLQAKHFDLVILDISIPYMTGLEVVEANKEKIAAGTPFIILSSLGAENIILKAFKLGVNDFVTKPFSPEELLVRARRALA